MTITQAQLDEWMALAELVVAHPWRHGNVRPLARTAVPALVQEVERLRAALTKAAEQFEFYAREHRAKKTESGYAKAQTNEHFASRCRAALPEEK